MPAPINLPDNPEYCPSCNTRFQGAFCYSCGEKKPSRKDYTLTKYATHAVDMFTHFDGKFFTTMKYLLFYPGKLTEENLAGRKVKLMKPVQLFVLISLVYFFLMKNVDVFVTFLENLHKTSSVYQEAERRAAAQETSMENFISHYDYVLANISKTFIFVLVPLISVGVWALFFRKSKSIVPHVIFTTHFFSFFLIFTLIYFELFLNSWINPQLLTPVQKAIGVGIEVFFVFVYLIIALRRVYKPGWAAAIVKTSLLFFWLFAMMGLYNVGIGWLNFLFL